MTKLYVAIDIGTLSNKALWATDEDFGFEFTQPSLTTLREHKYNAELGNPGLAASLVSYTVGGDRYFSRVGAIPRGGDVSTDQKKSDQAIGKILAILGKIVAEKIAPKGDVEVALRVLLPGDEYPEKDKLSAAIKEAAIAFTYNGKAVTSLRIETVQVVPEGFGLSLVTSDPEDKSFASLDGVGVLMIGHGDWAFSRFRQRKTTMMPGFGMTLYMQCFREYWPYDDEAYTMKAIASGNLQALAKDSADRSRLRQAIAMAQDDYLSESNLDQIKYSGVTHVILGGGGGYFMGAKITALFPRSVTYLELRPALATLKDWFPSMDETIAPLFLDCFMNFVRMVPKTESYVRSRL